MASNYALLISFSRRFYESIGFLVFWISKMIIARLRDVAQMNPIRPALMSPEERLTEIAIILAQGLIRLRALKSSQISGHLGEGSLDCLDAQRMHANHVRSGEA